VAQQERISIDDLTDDKHYLIVCITIANGHLNDDEASEALRTVMTDSAVENMAKLKLGGEFEKVEK
jgi:hypothetical protein